MRYQHASGCLFSAHIREWKQSFKVGTYLYFISDSAQVRCLFTSYDTNFDVSMLQIQETPAHLTNFLQCRSHNQSITYLITLDWEIGWWTCLLGKKKKAASDFAHSLTYLSVVSSREFFYFSPSFWDIYLSFPTLPSHKSFLFFFARLWGNKFSKLSHRIHRTSGSSYREVCFQINNFFFEFSGETRDTNTLSVGLNGGGRQTSVSFHQRESTL